MTVRIIKNYNSNYYDDMYTFYSLQNMTKKLM